MTPSSPSTPSGANDSDASGKSSENSESAATSAEPVIFSTSDNVNSPTYISSASEENAVLLTSGDVVLLSPKIEKTGDYFTTLSDPTGVNSAVLATGGSLSIENGILNSSAAHAGSVFASNSSQVVLRNSSLATSGNYSPGLTATSGAILSASNLTLETFADSSPALRVAGATLSVDGGTYKTSGLDSPALYLSGDPSNLRASVSISGASFELQTGDTLLFSGATADLNLSACQFRNADSATNFLRAEASPDGAGSNVRLNLFNQVIEGDLSVDYLSELELVLSSSYYMGVLNASDSARALSVTLDATSNLILAGDSYLTSLENADSTNMNIYANGYRLFVAGEEVEVNGSEAPTAPKTTLPDPSEDGLNATEETVADPCSDGSSDCDFDSRPNILFFIVGGVLVALAIVLPIVLLSRRKKSKK